MLGLLEKPASLLARTRLGRSAGRLAARLKQDVAGVTAIEFAFVAPPFFALLLSVIETGIVFTANQMLENAVYNGSRQILTGQLQTSRNSGASAADTYCKFVTSVCSGMSALLSPSTCLSEIQIDFKSFSIDRKITPADLAIPVTGTGALDTTRLDRGTLGAPGALMLVRAYYQYPVYVAHFGGGVGASDGGKRLLVATTTMAIEPFSGTGTTNDTSLASANCAAP